MDYSKALFGDDTTIQTNPNTGPPLPARNPEMSFADRVNLERYRDPKFKVKMIGKSLFPDLPEQVATSRVGIIDGNYHFLDDDGVIKPVDKNVLDKVEGYAAGLIADAPVIGMSAVGGALGGIPGLMGGAAIGREINNQIARAQGEPQTIPGNLTSDVMEAGTAAVSEGIARGAGRVFDYLRNPGKGPVQKIVTRQSGKYFDPAQVARNETDLNKYGLGSLPLNVKTQSPALQTRYQALANTEGPAQIYNKKMVEDIALPALQESVESQFGKIAPSAGPTIASAKFVNAANEAKDVFKQVRKAVSNPYFEKAFQSGTEVDIKPVMDEIDTLLEKVPRSDASPARKALQRMRDMLTYEGTESVGGEFTEQEIKNMTKEAYEKLDAVKQTGITPESIKRLYGSEGVNDVKVAFPGVLKKNGYGIDQVAGWYGFESEDALFEALRGYKPRGKFRGQFGLQKEQLARVPETDLQRLHGVKEELDAMFKQDEAFRSLDSKNKMRLARVKDRLVETLKASNEDYATGMNEYQNSSKLLNDFARGTQQFSGDRKPPKTVIKRIADLQGDEILKAPAMLFSQGSVADIRRAFKYVGSADEEAAWAMIRNRLDEVTAKIDMTSPSLGGGIWRALVKDPKTRNGLKAAMEELPGGEKKYRALMDWAQVMRDTDRMVYSNSQTTPMAASLRESYREAGGLATKVQAGKKFLTGSWDDAMGMIQAARHPEYSMKVMQAIWNDNDAMKQLMKVKRISDKNKRLIELGALISGVEAKEGLRQGMVNEYGSDQFRQEYLLQQRSNPQ